MTLIKDHPKEEKPLDYNYIDDGIFIGTNQCCQTHFDEELSKKGVTEDMSLEEERIDMPYGVEAYSWIPVADHTPPTPDQIEIGVNTLEKLASMNKKVYVHCKNGHGRAPTLVAAYFIKKRNISPQESIAFIKKHRSVIHLQDSQIEALENFYKTIS